MIPDIPIHPISWGRTFLGHHLTSESPLFHWKLADMIFGEDPRVVIAAPRGFAKTTITDLVCLLFGVAEKKFNFCILLSDTSSQSELLLEELKREAEENDRFRTAYPNVRPATPWAKNDLCFSNGVRIQALGAGNKVRGRKHKGSRPDLILVDDLENDEAVEKIERRQKLLRWFRASLLPCMSPNGRIRVIGTVLHSDGLLNRLLRNESWTRRKWRSISDEGVSLWPSWRPSVDLLREKEEYRQDGQLSKWYQEFQNQAIADEESPFKTEDFVYFDELPTDKKFYRSLFVDPAISKKDKADFTAYTVVYASSDGYWYVRKALRKRHDPAEIIQTVRAIHKQFKLDVIGIESVAYQKSLAFWLKKDDKYGLDSIIEEITPDTDKRRRILALQPYFRAHRIKFENGIGARLEEELLNVDSIDHDDLADSLAGHLFITLIPEKPRKKKPIPTDDRSHRAYEHRRKLLKRHSIYEDD